MVTIFFSFSVCFFFTTATKLVHYEEEHLDTTQRTEGLCVSPHDRSIVSYDVVRSLHQQICLTVGSDKVTALCLLPQSHLVAVHIVCGKYRCAAVHGVVLAV